MVRDSVLLLPGLGFNPWSRNKNPTRHMAQPEKEKKNKAYQSLYGAGAPIGKFLAFISLNVYVRKGKSNIKNLKLLL